MSHVEYFDMNAYFNTQLFLNSLSINLESGMIGDNQLTEEEAEILREAARASNNNSQNGELNGIADLICKAEKIFDKYGCATDCKYHRQSLKEFLDEISQRPDIVRKYGLEEYLKRQKAQEKPKTVTTQKRCRQQ